MEKSIRLRSNRDFKLVYKKNKGFWNRNFTVLVRKTKGQGTRIGFSVTKKYGKAVQRNQIKRKLREIIRHHYDLLGKGFDIVIIPKANTQQMEYKKLEDSMIHVLKLAFKR